MDVKTFVFVENCVGSEAACMKTVFLSCLPAIPSLSLSLSLSLFLTNNIKMDRIQTKLSNENL